MNAVAHDLSPALHIAEARVIELPSGTSFAQFLMVFLNLKRPFLFIDVSCLVLSFEEEEFFLAHILIDLHYGQECPHVEYRLLVCRVRRSVPNVLDVRELSPESVSQL